MKGFCKGVNFYIADMSDLAYVRYINLQPMGEGKSYRYLLRGILNYRQFSTYIRYLIKVRKS